MKIAFNNLPIQTGHKTRGIGFYAKNLLEHLKENPEVEIQEFSDISEVKDADVVHYPFFDLFQRSLPVIKKFPTVVTVHDVTPLVFPAKYPPGVRGEIKGRLQRRVLKSVSAVITDSKYSKKDIIKYLQLDPNKVFSIHLAPNETFRRIDNKSLLRQISKKYNLPEKFVLYVGDVNYNKNIINTIKASEEIQLPLVICGKQAVEIENLLSGNYALKGPRDFIRSLIGITHPELAHFQEVLRLIRSSHNIQRFGFVSTEDLVRIYNLAGCLLFVSYYEGFGLPILEAQSCGIPVITSNTSSMPEVAGEGALLVDPYNVDGIRLAMQKVLYDGDIRRRLIEKGLENVKRFSWQRTTQQTVDVYKKVVKH